MPGLPVLERGAKRDPPDPGFERPTAAERPPLADGSGERRLHGVAASIEVATDRSRYAREVLETLPVQSLELPRRRSSAPHCSNECGAAAFV
jgi:hypothetical protein